MDKMMEQKMKEEQERRNNKCKEEKWTRIMPSMAFGKASKGRGSLMEI